MVNYRKVFGIADKYLQYRELERGSYGDRSIAQYERLDCVCDVLEWDPDAVIRFVKLDRKHDLRMDLGFTDEDCKRFEQYVARPTRRAGKYLTLRPFNVSWEDLPGLKQSAKRALPHLKRRIGQ